MYCNYRQLAKPRYCKQGSNAQKQNVHVGNGKLHYERYNTSLVD